VVVANRGMKDEDNYTRNKSTLDDTLLTSDGQSLLLEKETDEVACYNCVQKSNGPTVIANLNMEPAVFEKLINIHFESYALTIRKTRHLNS